MKVKALLTIALMTSLSLGLSACTSVQPWERGILAKEHMALEAYPGQALYREHNYASREASAGGGAAKGGGCGCY